MKAAFGFRAAFFFTLFLAMRSPLKDAQSVEGEYHENALGRVDFLYDAPKTPVQPL
jgi:hypothetical protein